SQPVAGGQKHPLAKVSADEEERARSSWFYQPRSCRTDLGAFPTTPAFLWSKDGSAQHRRCARIHACRFLDTVLGHVEKNSERTASLRLLLLVVQVAEPLPRGHVAQAHGRLARKE